MLYDEPFVGQDPISMGALLRLIQELNSALHITERMVSHDLTETFRVADNVFILTRGKLVTPWNLSGSVTARILRSSSLFRARPTAPCLSTIQPLAWIKISGR